MDWFTPAKKLLQTALPLDFEGKPIYLLRAAEVETRLIPRCDCYGFTGVFLDLECEPLLRRKRCWAGRGVAIVIDDRRFIGRASWEFFRIILDAALHEAAHAVVCADDALSGPLDDLHPAMQTALAEFVLTRREVERPSLPLWHQHEADFIRAALHIVFRANVLAGYQVSVERVGCAGVTYGLSPAADYSAALGNEPRERADERISDILATPAPEAFVRLWERDTAPN